MRCFQLITGAMLFTADTFQHGNDLVSLIKGCISSTFATLFLPQTQQRPIKRVNKKNVVPPRINNKGRNVNTNLHQSADDISSKALKILNEK